MDSNSATPINQSPGTDSPRRGRASFWHVWLLIAILIAIAVVAVPLRSKVTNKATPHVIKPLPAYNFSYGQLVADQLKTDDGLKATFSRPTQINLLITSKLALPTELNYIQVPKDSRLEGPIAGFGIGIKSADASFSSDQIASYNAAMQLGSGSDYDYLVVPAKQLVADVLSRVTVADTYSQINYQTVKNLQAANLINAWTIDFSATPPNAKLRLVVPVMQGKVIIALGARAVYYFELNAAAYNWQPNQTVWQQIINSIKVDQ